MIVKLTIKNLQNETFSVDCDLNDTVLNFKKAIAESHVIEPKYEADLIKLLYKGKVMEDEDVVREFDIKHEEDFLVLVRQRPGKPKKPPKKKPNPNFGGMMDPFGNNPFMSSPLKSSAFGSQPFGQIPFAQHSLQPNNFGDGFGASDFGVGGFGAGGMGAGGFGAGGMGAGGFNAGGIGSGGFGAGGLGASGLGAGGLGTGGLGASGLGAGGLGTGGLGTGGLPTSHFDPSLPSSSGALGGAASLTDTSPEAFSTPEDRAEALQTLLAMGFDKNQSEQALRAAFYNVEVAVELITSNKIPKISQSTNIPPPTSTSTSTSMNSASFTSRLTTSPTAAPTAAAVTARVPPPPTPPRPAGGMGMGGSIQEMRDLLNNHPERLQMLKDALKAQHPEIAEMIDSDPQAFLQLLSQATGGDEPASTSNTGSSGSTSSTIGSSSTTGASSVGSTSGLSGSGGNSVTVTLSPYEQGVIQRLQDMGFERNRAIEAFLACDRREEFAINYLLNSAD